jgi:catechol 2,3-dioxygenase-like lactoylglutathione lyase family enzyme
VVQGVWMVAFRVRDFEASLHFYRDVLGLPLEVDSNNKHAEYSFHDPYFHFAIFPALPGEKSVRAHIAFQAPSCGDLFAQAVAAGAEVVTEPRSSLMPEVVSAPFWPIPMGTRWSCLNTSLRNVLARSSGTLDC